MEKATIKQLSSMRAGFDKAGCGWEVYCFIDWDSVNWRLRTW